MPLIVLSGIPSSGKSQRAKDLYDHFTQMGKKVVIISEETLLINKNEGYKDSLTEKMTRGSLKAAIERNLNKETVVISDSLNYIKGYRYELFCIARAAGTRLLVIYCDTPRDVSKQWNSQRDSSVAFSDNLLEELTNRFEVPNPKNRWDSPLFTLEPQHSLPFDLLYKTLFEVQELKPNYATQPQALSPANFVHELESKTQEITNVIQDALQSSMVGDRIKVPGSEKRVIIHSKLNLAELRIQRRQFYKFAQLHPPQTHQIADSFVDFLNSSAN
ncbi:hypothetical protein DICPUDRAFT_32350 [Dictyostelium purpureum]|uniref:Protein KTI12 homolog n=1 Tax=Dictyostelium purpureum TaxID=5786 RepID=F0ZIY7_DICPU|nr:uncharacterized protein DICPUDRAFT_32350 [Dictyostelium purpureum]EGC36124.1 hypothetical protein DICPUDRAFT_32350 [Dictyostelium purpureum]|eukprot:XP_003287381.1 hypothetical protein DICPUDRAFT_32350 [Dictyostelium purpureum]